MTKPENHHIGSRPAVAPSKAASHRSADEHLARSQPNRQSRVLRAALAALLLICWTSALACSPCTKSSDEWSEAVRQSILFSGTGQDVVTGNVNHIVLNLSKTFFDELISSNLKLVDPPDATTDLVVFDDENRRLGEATVSVQLRPSTLRVSLDRSIFLHSELTAIVQVNVPGMRETHVVAGNAKTLVELTADEEISTRTVIAAGGLSATSIYLPEREMDEQWSLAFRAELRAVAERLVTRSTNTVRRAIDVLEIIPPEPSAVGLQARITGLRQPWSTDRVLVDITTNLRVQSKPIELDDAAIRAHDEDLVVYLHPDLPMAWLRLVLASNPVGYSFDRQGVATDPPAYLAIPMELTNSTSEDLPSLEASFALYRFEDRPCERVTATVPIALDNVPWGEVDLTTYRMGSLRAFARRAFVELLFAGRFRLGTREIRWTPKYDPIPGEEAYRFSGPFESRETNMDIERSRDRGGRR